MYILDTDHMSLAEKGRGRDADSLWSRLVDLAPGEIASTIVSYEEQTRGWLAYAARARTVADLVEAYRRLSSHLRDWGKIPVLPFDAKSAVRYQDLVRQRLRIGTMDLRIAAIVLANGATLLTRNLRDVGLVPGLQVEDWTQ